MEELQVDCTREVDWFGKHHWETPFLHSCHFKFLQPWYHKNLSHTITYINCFDNLFPITDYCRIEFISRISWFDRNWFLVSLPFDFFIHLETVYFFFFVHSGGLCGLNNQFTCVFVCHISIPFLHRLQLKPHRALQQFLFSLQVMRSIYTYVCIYMYIQTNI